jgi:hypothetical protein
LIGEKKNLKNDLSEMEKIIRQKIEQEFTRKLENNRSSH